MTPVEIIQDALRRPLQSEDGDPVRIELLPGLTDAEIELFASRLPCPLPPHIRELLAFCRGFEGASVEPVDFTGELDWEFTDAFPHGLPIGADGFGNFWVADLLPDSRDWAPIYFASHDPPVILHQSPSLEHFLTEVFKMDTPPFTSAIDDVHEDRLCEVWRHNPGVLPQEECLASPDPELAAFARQLDPSYEIFDLRAGEIGSGFSWGRYGPATEIRRFGTLPIFAMKRRKSLFQRLFGSQ
ncbi:MAG: SMI1/KNR4 family protein [Armatimonadota bacterium]